MFRFTDREGPAPAAVRGFARRADEGATAAEYSLLIALIALAIMVGATSLGGKLSTSFEAGGNHVESGMTRNLPAAN